MDGRRRFLRLMALILAGAMLLCAGAACEEAAQYVENEWNYVDGSMDVSNGIPENAGGRLQRIRESGRLTVATEPYFPPQEFIDESREGQERFVGSDMEFARRIAQRMGVTLEIVPLDFSDVLSSVADGKYDLAISGLSFTSGRAAVLEMSKGYYYTGAPASSGLLIRQADAGAIISLDDLAGRDVVAMSGSLQETMAAENITNYRQFRRLDSDNDVYIAVTDGAADVGVVDIENALGYIERHPGCGLTIVKDVYFTLKQQYQGDRVAAKKGELELIYFVNGVIDELLESGEYDRWFDEYARFDAAGN